MVGWLAEADLADNSITVPNRDMMGVLEPYAGTFMRNGLCRIWCPKCDFDFLQEEIRQSNAQRRPRATLQQIAFSGCAGAAT